MESQFNTLKKSHSLTLLYYYKEAVSLHITECIPTYCLTDDRDIHLK